MLRSGNGKVLYHAVAGRTVARYLASAAKEWSANARRFHVVSSCVASFHRAAWRVAEILDESAACYLTDVVHIAPCEMLVVQHGGAALTLPISLILSLLFAPVDIL